jgi:hypothetical protein
MTTDGKQAMTAFGGRARGPAACLLLLTLAGGAAPARNVALLVAVGQFKDPGMQSEQLLGTAADIESVQQTITQRWGFAPKDVVALRDQDATHERILAEISALEQRSAPGDNVLIYFSGHGTSANDQNTRRYDLPYDSGAWVPYDLDQSSAEAGNRTLIIGRRDLLPRLKRLDDGNRWVVVVSDSCFSGQVVRSFGKTHARSRYLRMRTRDLGVARNDAPPTAPPALPSVRPPPPPYPYQHVLLLSGASDSESGSDISSAEDLALAPTLDGKYHGAFTDAFLRLLNGQLRPGEFNYAQAQQTMADFLDHRSFAQHPQILPALAEDPLNMQSSPFLREHTVAGPQAAPQPGPPVAPAIVRVRLESVAPSLRARIAALGGVSIVDQGADLVVSQEGDRAHLAGPAGDPIADTTAADPNLIKRIAAQAWLNHYLPVGTDSLGLRAETDPGSRGNTFVQCESFAFVVRLDKPAYVMIMDLDADGNLTVLYPSKPSERQIIAAGAARALPSNDPHDRILVTPPFGSDQVAVLAFEKQPEFFASLAGAQRFSPGDGRADALARGLAGAVGSVSVQQITVHTYPGSGTCGS